MTRLLVTVVGQAIGCSFCCLSASSAQGSRSSLTLPLAASFRPAVASSSRFRQQPGAPPPATVARVAGAGGCWPFWARPHLRAGRGRRRGVSAIGHLRRIPVDGVDSLELTTVTSQDKRRRRRTKPIYGRTGRLRGGRLQQELRSATSSRRSCRHQACRGLVRRGLERRQKA